MGTAINIIAPLIMITFTIVSIKGLEWISHKKCALLGYKDVAKVIKKTNLNSLNTRSNVGGRKQAEMILL